MAWLFGYKPSEVPIPIPINKCKIGTCYKHTDDNRYLGKFLRMDSRVRDSSSGTAAQTSAPIYVFEKEIIGDNYDVDIVIPTACISSTGGRRNRRVTRKARRNCRRSRSLSKVKLRT
jgi:hypothetical protein